jgi:protein SCO1/2
VPGLGRTVVSGDAMVGGPFTLTDQAGRPVRDGDFRGRYMLIYFGYSHCPDVCPTTLGVMADALDKLGADRRRIAPIFITIDPKRDTPKVLALYMKAFGPDFIGLTGSDAQIAAVEKSYRVAAIKRPMEGGNYAMDHSSVLYLMGPSGRMVSFYDEAVSPDALAKDLKSKI